MAARVVAACGGSVKGKTVAVLGLTFKPNTDDMRDSPSLDILPALQEAGAKIVAYDPEGMHEAKAMLPGVELAKDAYSAMEGADCALIITEWNEFRALQLDRVKKLLKTPIVVDLRNCYCTQMPKSHFHFSCCPGPCGIRRRCVPSATASPSTGWCCVTASPRSRRATRRT